MKLYHHFISSCSFRVRLVLAYKQIECELVSVDLLGREQHGSKHKGKNPLKQVPVLEDGSHPIIESSAICDYLERKHPEPTLLPDELRPYVLAACHILGSSTHSLVSAQMFRLLEMNHLDTRKIIIDFARRGFQAYHDYTAAFHGNYTFGELTLADFYLVPAIENVRLRFGYDVSEFPALQGIYQRVMEDPRFAAARPNAFNTDVLEFMEQNNTKLSPGELVKGLIRLNSERNT